MIFGKNDPYTILKEIWEILKGAVSGSTPLNVDSSGGGGSATVNVTLLGASASQEIPAGAKGWTFTVLSGTATIEGVEVPAGFSDSDTRTTAEDITIETAAASSAYVRWNT